MITSEMLSYLLLQCSVEGWITTDKALEIERLYPHSIDLYKLEAIIDYELQIMSLSEAIEIIEQQFTIG